MSRSGNATAAQRWQQRLQRYHLADLSVREFCDREGVSQASFYYWRKRLGDTAGVPAPAFEAVQVLAATGGLVIALPGGIRMDVAADQAELARAVVRELALLVRSDAAGGESC